MSLTYWAKNVYGITLHTVRGQYNILCCMITKRPNVKWKLPNTLLVHRDMTRMSTVATQQLTSTQNLNNCHATAHIYSCTSLGIAAIAAVFFLHDNTCSKNMCSLTTVWKSHLFMFGTVGSDNCSNELCCTDTEHMLWHPTKPTSKRLTQRRCNL